MLGLGALPCSAGGNACDTVAGDRTRAGSNGGYPDATYRPGKGVLLIALHGRGAGGPAVERERYTKLDNKAKRAGFAVAYLDGQCSIVYPKATFCRSTGVGDSQGQVTPGIRSNIVKKEAFACKYGTEVTNYRLLVRMVEWNLRPMDHPSRVRTIPISISAAA